MDTIKLDKGRTGMIAHRGLSGLEKENTCAAFVAAANRSYYGIETDVHRTLDGRFVVIHDSTTARVSGEDLRVEDSTFESLQGLRLTDIDGSLVRSDLTIPSMSEYVRICQRYAKTCILELKNRFSKEDVFRVCDEILQLDYLDHVVFISFIPDNLIYVRMKHPDQPAQLLTKRFFPEMVDLLAEYGFDLDIDYTALTVDNIKMLHAAGIKVNCWTVNDPDTAAELISYGVDFITTDILE